MEGSYARFRAGTSDDAYFAALEQGVPALARRALEFASGDCSRASRRSRRSTITGVWSEGPVPLRALRSMTAHVTRSATGRVAEHEVDAHAAVLVEVAGAVVPVAVEPVGVGVHAAEEVFHAPLLELHDGVTFGSVTWVAPTNFFGSHTSRSSGATLKSPSTTSGSSGELFAASQSCSVWSHTSLRS